MGMAIRLHHPKLDTTTHWDGSTLGGLEHWGYRREKWCMKQKPKDWRPLPEVYRLERERAATGSAGALAGRSARPQSGARPIDNVGRAANACWPLAGRFPRYC
ncbi:hypothetical protein MPLB_1870044 [Mesorhizobium sp. ORS 3324]|nr:hypothetical protein MPLB_1870044 [Mesorhizobium sp. ORS 3324]